jgi:hypothetical protein
MCPKNQWYLYCVDCYPFSGPPIPYTPEMFLNELGLRLNIRVLCETILNPKLCNSRVAAKFTDGVPALSS